MKLAGSGLRDGRPEMCGLTESVSYTLILWLGQA
jgi:hypothetical protein